MAKLSVQSISQSGISPSFVSADSLGDYILNDGKSFIHLKNGGTSSVTVTVDSITKCNQGFDHDLSIAIAAGTEKVIGPFPTNRFNDENGRLNISYSSVTSLTIAAFRL